MCDQKTLKLNFTLGYQNVSKHAIIFARVLLRGDIGVFDSEHEGSYGNEYLTT
jgi:hypothetical protein